MHYGARYLEHFWNIAEHACARSLARYFFDRASEIDVENIGTGFGHDSGSLYHRPDLTAVDLYGGGAFAFGYMELAGGGGDIAHKRVGRHEFRVGHVGALLLADEAERGIGDIFHRRKHHRTLA